MALTVHFVEKPSFPHLSALHNNVGCDVTNVVVFDVIRALNRVALNQNRNVVFTRSTAFCFILTVAILYV